MPRLDSLGVPYDVDGFGNIWASVAPAVAYTGPAFLWSCHVDTVHIAGGRQAVEYGEDGRTVQLVKRKAGRCLGADDGAGLWLMLEMMRAGVAGGYVFHRGEEVGRLGSEYAADREPERLKPYDACVAFDRRDFADFISHQMGRRCCSQAFAGGMSTAINLAGHKLQYRPDDGGSYTDSYSYASLVAECANVSIGYNREHGPMETLDALHLWRLRESMVRADFGAVPVERDCSVDEFDDWGTGGGWGGYHSWAASYQRIGTTGASVKDVSDHIGNLGWQERRALRELVQKFPEAIVELLSVYGLGVSEVLDELTSVELAEALQMGGGSSL